MEDVFYTIGFAVGVSVWVPLLLFLILLCLLPRIVWKALGYLLWPVGVLGLYSLIMGHVPHIATDPRTNLVILVILVILGAWFNASWTDDVAHWVMALLNRSGGK